AHAECRWRGISAAAASCGPAADPGGHADWRLPCGRSHRHARAVSRRRIALQTIVGRRHRSDRPWPPDGYESPCHAMRTSQRTLLEVVLFVVSIALLVLAYWTTR